MNIRNLIPVSRRKHERAIENAKLEAKHQAQKEMYREMDRQSRSK